jgi:hypothetical protein
LIVGSNKDNVITWRSGILSNVTVTISPF